MFFGYYRSCIIEKNIGSFGVLFEILPVGAILQNQHKILPLNRILSFEDLSQLLQSVFCCNSDCSHLEHSIYVSSKYMIFVGN